MLIEMCKSKIHRARITETNLHYEGSITIPSDLMKAAHIYPFERVQIVNVNNGMRFDTYAMEGKSGSGEICLNGRPPAAASRRPHHHPELLRLGRKGNQEGIRTKVVRVDEKNKSSK